MKTVLRDIGAIIPYAKNPRINDKAVDAVARSIQEFGFRQPIVVDKDGTVIIGHTRLKAAIKLGLLSVPIHIADKLTPTQVRGLRLADNKTAEAAEWDYDLLPIELTDLQGEGVDLGSLGFGEDELEKILGPQGTEGLTDPDEIPEPPAKAITKPGDLIKLGDHRLLCGDSTKVEDVERLMGGKKASLMATDPPYLVDYQGGNHPQSWQNKKTVKDKHWDDYQDPDQASDFFFAFITASLPCLHEHAAIYQWHADLRRTMVQSAWERAGIHIHQILIWFKSRPVLTRSHYMWQHEPCMYGWMKGKCPKRKPDASSRSVWEISQKGECDGIHPTQKPVELFARPIGYHTVAGEICYDPFLGSGTTLIAAEKLGRKCYGIEIAPIYCDVIIARWQAFTGKKAKRCRK